MMTNFGPIRTRSVAAWISALTFFAFAAPAQGQIDTKVDTIRIAYNPGTVLRLYAALEKETFKKYGLKIDLIRFESGAAASAAFAAGSVDLGFTGIPGFLASRLAGANTQVFMIENDSGGAEGLVVRPQAGINSLRDLPGKTIGTVIGTTSWMGLISGLQESATETSKVKIQNVPPSAWLPAFDRGDVDGLFIWSPMLFTLAENGGQIIATMSQYRKDPLLWQARREFLSTQADVARRFVIALEEGQEAVAARDEKFIKRMAKETASKESAILKTVHAIKTIPLAAQISKDSPYSLSSPIGLKKQIDEWLKVYSERGIFRQIPDLTNALNPNPIRTALQR